MGVHQARRDSAAAHTAVLRPIRGGGKGAKTFEVMVGRQRQRVSVDWLQPHTGSAPVTAAPPARRPPKEQTAVVGATPPTYTEVVAGGGSL